MTAAIASGRSDNTVDIFSDVVRDNHDVLLAAVVRAAHELGIFRLLAGPEVIHSLSAEDIASSLDLPGNRLNRLLDVLVAEGILARSAAEGRDGLRCVRVPDRTEVSAGGWDGIASVVTSDKPLLLRPEWLAGHLRYVAAKGQVAAPVLWDALQTGPGTSLLDIGGGMAAYSTAFLERHSTNHATLVDLKDVMSLVHATEAMSDPRLSTITADAREHLPAAEYDVVLIANLLHLYGADDCRKILSNAFDAAAPGGLIVVKDVSISPSRTSPLSAVYFALNMALYTESGDVHTVPTLSRWLEEAGLTDVREVRIPALAASVTLVGSRPKG